MFTQLNAFQKSRAAIFLSILFMSYQMQLVTSQRKQFKPKKLFFAPHVEDDYEEKSKKIYKEMQYGTVAFDFSSEINKVFLM